MYCTAIINHSFNKGVKCTVHALHKNSLKKG